MKAFFFKIKNYKLSFTKLSKNGFKLSFIICLIATYILHLYILNPISHINFNIGFLLAKLSFSLFGAFFTGNLFVSILKNDF